MGINYDKLFNPNNTKPKEDISDIYNILEFEEILLAISEKLINYRNNNNLTQKQLSDKLKVNQSMIAKLEKGNYNPTFKQIYNISLKLTNSSEFFIEILEEIQSKINKISKNNYKLEISSEDKINNYWVTKIKNTKLINIEYKGVMGGKNKYEECTSSITNVG